MQWDEDVFGLVYDLDVFMIVAVSYFNMGAMENKGLNIFNANTFLLTNRQQQMMILALLKLLSLMNIFITGQVIALLAVTGSSLPEEGLTV